MATLVFLGNLLILLLSLIGVGIPFLIIYHIANSYLCHKAAVELNLQAFKLAAGQQ